MGNKPTTNFIDFKDPRLEMAIENWNLVSFLDDYNVDYSLEGKNIGRNFIGVNPCPYCFTGDTLILTENGLIPIENLKNKNIKILSQNGNFNQVMHFWERELKNTNMVEYFAYGMVKPAICTPNHAIFCAEVIKGKHLHGIHEFQSESHSCRTYQTWQFDKIPAEELTGNAFNKNNIWVELPTINPKFNKEIKDAYFLGVYCGDGSISGGKNLRSITFALNDTSKVHIIEKIINFYGNKYILPSKTGHGVIVQIHSTNLVNNRFLQCGRGSHNKIVPNEILFNSNEKTLKDFIQGIEDTDGSKREDGNTSIVTTSLQLALQISIILRRLNCPASISTYTPEQTGKDGIKRKEHTMVNYNYESTKKHPYIKFINNKWYGKLKYAKTLRKHKKFNVYNLTVHNDRTYCANGSIVKNCGDNRNHFAVHEEEKFGSCFICKGYAHPIKLISYFGRMSFKKAFDYLLSQTPEQQDIINRVEIILKNKRKQIKREEITLDVLPRNKLITYADLKNTHLKNFFIKRKLHLWHIKRYQLRLCTDKEFNGYIIFPMLISNHPVAYQLRHLIRKKYHNSTNLDKFIYNEENIINKKPIILVEGFLDFVNVDSFIRCYYPGKITVVTGGLKSISRYQIDRLRSYSPSQLIVMFDGDSWFDYYRIKNSIGYDVNYIILNKEKDPNDLTWKELNKIFTKEIFK
jgi:hypothetical protein